MRSVPFAIHGMGRIGRALARIAHDRPGLELVAVNDLMPVESIARLLARDTVHGRFHAGVMVSDDGLELGGRRVEVFREGRPERVPWQGTGAEIVVEASGQAATRGLAGRHLRPGTGPEKVLISAIADDADLVVCRGINEGSYDRDRHHVVSNASCTTNCLAVVIEVLRRDYGIRQAFINEVHSYTANQRLVDSYHPDPRRSRAAAANIVPTGTAAPAAVERLIPELRGRLDGLAVRVPTPNVALLDVVANLERPASAEQLNTSFEAWSAGRLAGLLDTVTEPWVSSDFVGCPASAVVDLDLTRRVGEDLHRVVAWYDNEWGYAHRLADILEIMGSGHGAEPNRPEHGLEPTGESP